MDVNDTLSGYIVEYAGECAAMFEDLKAAENFASNCEESPVTVRYFEATITDLEEYCTFERRNEGS